MGNICLRLSGHERDPKYDAFIVKKGGIYGNIIKFITMREAVLLDYQHTTAPLYASDGGMVGAIEIGRNMSGVRRTREQVVELNQLLHADHHEKHHAIITENPEMLSNIAKAVCWPPVIFPSMIVGETGKGAISPA